MGGFQMGSLLLFRKHLACLPSYNEHFSPNSILGSQRHCPDSHGERICLS